MVMASDGKRRINKLTSEKLQQYRNEILSLDGKHVDLTSRGIERILSLEGIDAATKLDLSHNKLTKLSELKSVPRVTMLKLTDNNLNGDGLAEIQHLKKLVILNASENHVTRVPFEVIRNARTLKALVLNNNSISTLDWIPKLPNLNSLILSHNNITKIPQRVVDGLPSLKKISISHNLIEEIPNLSQLSEITELRLSHNRIKAIPAHLAQLKNLRVLELSHNDIDDWSGLDALSTLENLRQLNLAGNPICGRTLTTLAQPVEENCSESDDEGDKVDSDDEKKEKNNIQDYGNVKQMGKEAKKLDAKHKQYNFKMKRLFPHLVVRDAVRVLDKRVHGYVAPPKEDKTAKSFSNPKIVTRKRMGDDSDKQKTNLTSTRVDAIDATKLSKKEKKGKKQRKTERLAADRLTMDAGVFSEPERKKLKFHAEKNKATKKLITEVLETASVNAVKEKKWKDKRDKLKDQRQPKEVASGVVALKHLKMTKQVQRGTKVNAVDLSQINLTPDVGFGGPSAWDNFINT
ncbi:hypothetical protein CCR75_007453 [Bremia lactucae]|uniref:Uncharacterized protein n=1 Tax=Bremia lactucae TaxID=4779 RepID=A0A976FEZ7_BRELC|nr:hypothetical protein CCR75_007453 [Bremia lactucae]